MPPTLEEAFESACHTRKIPGAVLVSLSKSKTLYSNAFGSSISDTQNGVDKPLNVDSVFVMASCTKLLTTIATMQCVERGLVGIDDSVEKWLPELAGLQIIQGFREGDDGEEVPVLKRRTEDIKVRHLLTHTSGLSYDFMHPKLMRYRQAKGERLGGKGVTLLDHFGIPLTFEPGTSFVYGASLDWAGRLVEVLTGLDLDTYMKQNLWDPLGIKDMTFWIEKRPDMKQRLSTMTIRNMEDENGPVIPLTRKLFSPKAVDALGGQGVYGTIPEYAKILHSLLVDDEKLLKKKTTAQMFSPQLGEASRKALNGLRGRPEVWKMFVGEFPEHIPLDWGFGGILTAKDDEVWRGENTMMWSGLPNLFWFIDRKRGICGIFGTQVVPPGDPQTNALISIFEKAMYHKLAETPQSKL